MKLSKFNTAVNYDDSIIYHNSYTHKFLLLDPFLYDLVHSIKDQGDIATLYDIHQDFYQALYEYGFLVEDEVDEMENVRKLIASVDEQDHYYHLIINPTMNCNFSCWYCYETHEKKSQIMPETIDKIERLLNNICRANPQMHTVFISFFGGEPMLFFNRMVDIMRKAKEITTAYNKDLQIAITSNGLLIDQHVIEELKNYTVAGFQITLDGNKENHDMVRFISKSKGSYEPIMENIKNLARNGLFITLRINFTMANLVGLEDVIDDLQELSPVEKQCIELSMQKVFQEPNSQHLADLVKVFKYYAKAGGIRHQSAVTSDTVRNSCYADKTNQMVVNYNGDVYKCNARDFNQMNKEGVLDEHGEVTWNEQHNKRLTSKLTNKPCLSCSILPICGGGCSQMIVENVGKDFCVHDFDESSKKRVILNMFMDEQIQSA